MRRVHVADPMLGYALAIVRATREDPRIGRGASSRAAIMLVRCAQAWAVLRGRDFVRPDDVRALAVPVLAHRVVLAGALGVASTGWTTVGVARDAAEGIVRELAARVRVPVEP